ncbi:MAG: acetate kinase [Deferribacteres bacterium]|nr:acetate kinase [candidate division KSB1 bacterium]MCB9503461.1 acetate kinase [Deferribacteres bacterium]
MKILVLNCGSSSIKYQLFEMPENKVLTKGLVQRIGEEQSQALQGNNGSNLEIDEKIPDHAHAMHVIERMLTHPEKGAISSLEEIEACGHRVVHGGETFTGSVVCTQELEKVIEAYCELAPLHNPANLTGIRAAKAMFGDVPQIACFDTAFHQSIPKTAYLYGLPYEMYQKHKIRRYGFHGTSHRYVAREAAERLGKHKYAVNLITCHLGNGCSIAAIREGKSVDTSMGLTPLEGLVMGTRTGDLDPAIIFHLIRLGYQPGELDTLFNKKSGLLGISGLSNDVRDLQEKEEAGDESAKLALDIFAYRIKKYIGSYLAVLNRCDAVVFTGGIGENSISMRERILNELDNLGLQLDNKKNQTVVGEAGEIHTNNSRIKILVIPTNEEGAIARDTYALAREYEMVESTI